MANGADVVAAFSVSVDVAVGVSVDVVFGVADTETPCVCIEVTVQNYQHKGGCGRLILRPLDILSIVLSVVGRWFIDSWVLVGWRHVCYDRHVAIA
jgi:hypothetical protein